MGRRARALGAGASAVKERAGVPSRAGETLRAQRRPPARKERAAVGGRPRDRRWCASTSDPRRPPQEAAAPAAGSRRAGMPRLLAPLLCLTLLPALAARGRRLRARNFARLSETSAAPCARPGWMGVRAPAARVGSQSGPIGHGSFPASSRVRGTPSPQPSFRVDSLYPEHPKTLEARCGALGLRGPRPGRLNPGSHLGSRSRGSPRGRTGCLRLLLFDLNRIGFGFLLLLGTIIFFLLRLWPMLGRMLGLCARLT